MCSNKCYKAARDKGTVDRQPSPLPQNVRFLSHLSVRIRQRSAARLCNVHWGAAKSVASLSKRSQCHERLGNGRSSFLLHARGDAVCYTCANITWQSIPQTWRIRTCDVKGVSVLQWDSCVCVCVCVNRYCLLFQWCSFDGYIYLKFSGVTEKPILIFKYVAFIDKKTRHIVINYR
jgi:rubredoxin